MKNNIPHKFRFERKWVFKNTNYIDILNKAFKSNFLFQFHLFSSQKSKKQQKYYTEKYLTCQL